MGSGGDRRTCYERWRVKHEYLVWVLAAAVDQMNSGKTEQLRADCQTASLFHSSIKNNIHIHLNSM